ncbi:hypothetical protein WJX72_006766 [[Myrmecia] bisecta]|uniref:Nitronate monooxygenase domain-containing protein n=1 Tax=[Myrmecia] bisecta TaxID=41462 RepID=A0AAW1Q0I2_9CHLO
MAGAAGSELAAAVARAGGLGFLGAAAWTPEQLASEWTKAQGLLADDADSAHSAIGIGLLNFINNTRPEILLAAIDCRPRAIWLSFGEYAGAATRIKEAGIKLVCQVQSLEQAVEAVERGADVIVVQGSESGGHGASHAALFCLVPEAVDVVAEACAERGISPVIPVAAAGGIADGRQIAAALALGATGVVVGTRLVATPESTYHDKYKELYVQAASDAHAQPSTLRTTVYDEIDGRPWPKGVDGRYIRNTFTEQHAPLTPLPQQERDRFRDVIKAANSAAAFDGNIASSLAGQGLGFIAKVEPAEQVITRLVNDARAQLASLRSYVKIVNLLLAARCSTVVPREQTDLHMESPQDKVVSIYKSFEAGNLEGVLSRLPDDFVAHVYGKDAGLPWGGEFHGKDELVQGFLAPLAQHTKTNSLQVTHLAQTTGRVFTELKWDAVCHGIPLVIDHEVHMWEIRSNEVVVLHHYAHPDKELASLLQALSNPMPA